MATITGGAGDQIPRLKSASPKTPESHEDRKPYSRGRRRLTGRRFAVPTASLINGGGCAAASIGGDRGGDASRGLRPTVSRGRRRAVHRCHLGLELVLVICTCGPSWSSVAASSRGVERHRVPERSPTRSPVPLARIVPMARPGDRCRAAYWGRVIASQAEKGRRPDEGNNRTTPWLGGRTRARRTEHGSHRGGTRRESIRATGDGASHAAGRAAGQQRGPVGLAWVAWLSWAGGLAPARRAAGRQARGDRGRQDLRPAVGDRTAGWRSPRSRRRRKRWTAWRGAGAAPRRACSAAGAGARAAPPLPTAQPIVNVAAQISLSEHIISEWPLNDTHSGILDT
jgi:hypothetical protein